jgi:hypothetical protein
MTSKKHELLKKIIKSVSKKILFFILPLMILTSFTTKAPENANAKGVYHKKTTLVFSVVCYSQANIPFDVFSWSADDATLVQDTYDAIYEYELHYWGWNYIISSGQDHSIGKTLDPTKSWSANGVHNGDEIDIFGTIE